MGKKLKARLHFTKANDYFSQGKYKLAIEEYSRAIDLDDKYAIAYINKGNAFCQLGQYYTAIKVYSNAIRIIPMPQLYYNRGLANRVLEKFNEAMADYSEAIMLRPNYIEAYINRGNIKIKLELYSEAISDYNAALKINMDCAEAYYNRAVAKKRLSRYKEAKTDFEKAFRLNYGMDIKGAIHICR